MRCRFVEATSEEAGILVTTAQRHSRLCSVVGMSFVAPGSSLRTVELHVIVRGNHDALRGVCHAVGQTQRGVWQPIVEQPLPAAEDDRMDEQDVRIDEPVAHQRLQEIAAAEDDEVEAWLSLQTRDRLSRVAGESVEFSQGSGSRSVLEATYFCERLRIALYGLSVRFGHTS